VSDSAPNIGFIARVGQLATDAFFRRFDLNVFQDRAFGSEYSYGVLRRSRSGYWPIHREFSDLVRTFFEANSSRRLVLCKS
jgi:hypothetical protein